MTCSSTPRAPWIARSAALLGLVAAGCSEEDEAGTPAEGGGGAPAAEGGFPDEARARGLSYTNVSGEAHKPTVLDANGAGVALFDLENDGDLDVAFGQGAASLGELVHGPGADLALYANDGQGTFAELPGPGLAGWWTGLAAGDVDGDGDADLVAGAYGNVAVCLADGARLNLLDGVAAGLIRPGALLLPGAAREAGRAPDWATSLALFDADRDGELDLYVGRYLELDPLDPPLGELGEGALAFPCIWKGLDVFCGPRGMKPQRDSLFRGRGDGTFEDVSTAWIPGLPAAFTLGVAPFDADMDGDTDLFIANDSVENQLLVNEMRDGAGGFSDLGMQAGVALNLDGLAEAGMGIAVGDVNRDGLPDLAVTNFSDEPTQLYFGAQVGFTCATYVLRLGHATRRLLSWGVHLDDFDADGMIDLFTANGHVYPQADEEGTGTRYGQPDTLFRIGRREVEPWAPRVPGSILEAALGTRGSAVGDVNGDGTLDLVLARIDAPAALGINGSGAGNQRLLVRCEGPARDAGANGSGPRTPRDGIGTRVVLVPKFPEGTPLGQEFALLREVQTARGFQSASTPWLHFGLGALGEYQELKVLWPSGHVELLGAGTAGRRIVVREGAGIVFEEEL